MASDPELKNIIDNFKGKKILIVGDVMVDEYLWGEVNRISPEAPVPVVSCNNREHRMGGAANVAINIKAMGAEPIICSVIGKDEAGEIFKQLLEKRQMVFDGIIESSGRITTVKTRVIGDHQHLLRVDHEITSLIERGEEDLLLEKIKNQIAKQPINAIIFQDYDKGVITRKVIEGLTSLAQEKKIPTLVDPKKRNFLAYKGVTLFKPNFKELTEGLNINLKKSDTQGIFEAAKILHSTYAIENIMITLSEKGVFVSDGNTYKTLPAEERDIADVSGAGDTVIAVISLSLASGLDVFKAAQLANQAGGLVCEKVGVVPITPEIFLLDTQNSR